MSSIREMITNSSEEAISWVNAREMDRFWEILRKPEKISKSSRRRRQTSSEIQAVECRPRTADRVTGNWLLIPGVRLGRLIAETLRRIAARQHARLAIDDVLRPPGSHPQRHRIFSLVHDFLRKQITPPHIRGGVVASPCCTLFC